MLYPDGYGTSMVTLDQMRARHAGKMHPEFCRRFFAYMEHKSGLLGVGGGWRPISSVSAASAAGKSFHQDQTFASGFVGYAAVDLVAPTFPVGKHRSPTWAETVDAPEFGLHTFIKVPDEPWHIQCIEMRGWQTWVNAGRPDPQPFTLPGDLPDPEDDDMKIGYYVLPPAGYPDGSPQFVVIDGQARYRTNADRPGLLPDETLPADQYDNLRRSLDVR